MTNGLTDPHRPRQSRARQSRAPKSHARRGRALRDFIVNVALLAPACGFLFVALAVPSVQLILVSFGLAGIGAKVGFTVQYYVAVWQDVLFTSAFVFSLRIAAAATLISITFATILTALLQVDFPGRRLVNVLCKVLLVVPSLVAAFMVLTIIGPGGMAARLLKPLGVIWPSLLDARSGIGIVLVLLCNSVPLTLLIVPAVAAAIPRDVIEAARTLGAGPGRVFLKIMLPLCAPGIGAAGMLVFIGCFGSLAIPSLIGPAYPRAISVMMTNEFLRRGNWGTASVVGVAMIATTAAVLAVYHRLAEAAGLRNR